MTETDDRPLRLDARLAEACRRFADAPAVSDATGSLTYASFAKTCAELSELLKQTGLTANEPVAVAVSNLATDFAALAAVWAAGGVAVPLHRGANAETIGLLLSQTKARFLVNVGSRLPLPRLSDTLVQNVADVAPPDREILRDAAWVVFTSGSTGAPKGVVHAHDRYTAKLDAIVDGMALPFPQRVLMPLQLTFAYAHWVGLTTLLTGGEVMLASPFRLDTFLEQLGSGATAMAVVPTMLRRLRPLIEAQNFPPFSGVVMTGGEPLPDTLGRFLRGAWPEARIWDIYGLTESATSDFHVRPEEYDRAAGCIGKPVPGIDFRIEPKSGELQINSPYVMRGYLDEPELTANAFQDGYLRTGDQARLRQDGFVEITGRLKDIVNRAGNKIAPIEVEASFLAHPDVLEALAAGIPDPIRGEALHVVVVRRPGATLDQDELLRWAAERMERFKLPDSIHVVAELPTGGTDKADRNLLRDMVASGLLS